MSETLTGLMTRRGALERLGILAGGALSVSVVTGLAGGCRAAGPGMNYAPLSLDAEAYRLVGTLSDVILPDTDTPGAVAAGVPSFVDQMLTTWFPAAERDEIIASLADLRLAIDASIGSALGDATQDERVTVVRAMADGRPVAASHPKDFSGLFRQIKELTVVGYYTSEIGATQELHVMPMGEFKGDIPYAEVGKAWT